VDVFTLQVKMMGVGLVERYLRSLPEYSPEMTRANVIEIYSYNGLLPTKKVIGKWTRQCRTDNNNTRIVTSRDDLSRH